MPEPAEILSTAFRQVSANLDVCLIDDKENQYKINYLVRNLKNRAGVRLLMSCLLAKIHKPELDVRKPYTEIGDLDAFSGRRYDESYITSFINEHNLPCNSTTAFFTPALRNINITLTKNVQLLGKPPEIYKFVLELLDDVHTNKITPKLILEETIRLLIIYRNEKQLRLEALTEELKTAEGSLPPSSEDIVNLVEKHLSLKGTSRLPVLIVASAYQVAQDYIAEKCLPLQSHNAADEQTGSLGDIEITLIGDERTVTCYEMKNKIVTINDIDRALQKLRTLRKRVDNYIFILKG